LLMRSLVAKFLARLKEVLEPSLSGDFGLRVPIGFPVFTLFWNILRSFDYDLIEDVPPF